MSATVPGRLHALCCVCGHLRIVSSRNYGRNVQSQVTRPQDPTRLAEMQSRGHMLEVEPYWRRLNTFKCSACDAWTRHALVDLTTAPNGAVAEVHHDPFAFLAGTGVTIAWASDMRWRAVWLPDERIAVLHTEESPALLADDVRDFIAGRSEPFGDSR